MDEKTQIALLRPIMDDLNKLLGNGNVPDCVVVKLLKATDKAYWLGYADKTDDNI